MCILLVEDDPLVRMVTAATLTDAGHEVMEAEDGPHALALIRGHPGHFHALVTDFHMPHHLTGGDVVERMRRDYPAIPMVIASALTGVVDPAWRQRHSVHLLQKPYTAGALLSLLARLRAEAGSKP